MLSGKTNSRKRGNIIGLALAAIIVIVVISPLVVSVGTPCEECHNDVSLSGDYIYHEPVVRIFASPRINPESSGTLTVEVTNPDAGKYEVRSITGSIEIENVAPLRPPGISLDNCTFSMPDISASDTRASYSTTMYTASDEGANRIYVNITYEAYYHHPTTENVDSHFYDASATTLIQVKPSNLTVELSDITLEESQAYTGTFNITAIESISDVSLSFSPGVSDYLSVTPDNIAAMSAGETITITVTGEVPFSVDNSQLIVIWKNPSGNWDYQLLGVEVSPVADSGGGNTSYLWLSGRILGLLTLAILLASLYLGMAKKLEMSYRKRFHCGISWIVLAVSVYHGLVLLVGPYRELIWNKWIIFGDLSAIFMAVIGINGLMYNWMVRRNSKTAWRVIHIVFSVLAIVFGLIHAILIGTDFAIIRGLWG